MVSVNILTLINLAFTMQDIGKEIFFSNAKNKEVEPSYAR